MLITLGSDLKLVNGNTVIQIRVSAVYPVGATFDRKGARQRHIHYMTELFGKLSAPHGRPDPVPAIAGGGTQ